MDPAAATELRELFRSCVVNTLGRVAGRDTLRPFHSALLPEETIFWSRLERSFSTSFGQRAIEEASRIVCEAAGAKHVTRQKDTAVTLKTTQWEYLDSTISSHQTGGTWAQDMHQLAAAASFGAPLTRPIRSDLYWVKDNIEHFMSIKTVQPNKDQTMQAKRDLLALAAGGVGRKAYFGLYYNPFGDSRESYSHNPPMGVFNFETDHDVVLIGRDYWDTIGGSEAYEEVLGLAVEVGEETRGLIQAYRADFVADQAAALAEQLET